LKSLKVTPEILEEAEKEGSGREFFFRLLQLLSGGELSRKEIKELNHKELIRRIVKENGLEAFFFPSKAKNIYNALRKAFRERENRHLEEEWERKLSGWRDEFEKLIHRAVSGYLLSVNDEEILRDLQEKGWFLASDLVNKVSKEGLENLLNRASSLQFLSERTKMWLSLPAFKRREKIVKDILKAYELGCLELAIYALFPLSEGIVWESFVKDNLLEADVEKLIKKRNRKFVTIQYAVKLIVQAVRKQEKLPDFLDWVAFVDYREGELNRHAIQHGVAVNFGTQENFLKLFFFVDFLHQILSLAFQSKR